MLFFLLIVRHNVWLRFPSKKILIYVTSLNFFCWTGVKCGYIVPESRRSGSGAGGAACEAGEGAGSGGEGAEEAVLQALRRQLQPHLLAALHARTARPSHHHEQVLLTHYLHTPTNQLSLISQAKIVTD